MHPFRVEVPDLVSALVELVRQVPRGHVTTYGDLARTLGDSRAAVWVASVMADSPPSLWEVAHRVVSANGEPSPRHSANALARLVGDRVPMNGSRVDLAAARFHSFKTDRPLESLKRDQEQLAERICLSPLETRPTTVAALDVSYRSDGVAVAAYVLMNAEAPDAWTRTASLPITFPYIPGYLSYRELPVHAQLLRKVADEGHVAPLFLVDGNGILHPRRTGIATQLGVLAGHPTVGVSKSLLCGTVVFDGAFGAGTGRVIHRGETIAAALPPSPRGKKPIYVSPGNLCTLEDAVAVVAEWRRGLRLPEPIRRADALSRAVAREGLEGV